MAKTNKDKEKEIKESHRKEVAERYKKEMDNRKPEKKKPKEKAKDEKEPSFWGKLFKKIGKAFSDVGNKVVDTLTYITLPKDIKKTLIEESLKKAKLELKSENVKTRKEKMDIINTPSKDMNQKEKLIALSELAHKEKRTISIGLKNGGVMQFEPVGEGVAIKYADPHFKPGTKDLVYDFVHAGGVLYKSYNSKRVASLDLEPTLKVLDKERGFDKNLFQESVLKNVHEERITDRNLENPSINEKEESLTEKEKLDLDKAIEEGNKEEIESKIDELGANVTQENSDKDLAEALEAFDSGFTEDEIIEEEVVVLEKKEVTKLDGVAQALSESHEEFLVELNDDVLNLTEGNEDMDYFPIDESYYDGFDIDDDDYYESR